MAKDLDLIRPLTGTATQQTEQIRRELNAIIRELNRRLHEQEAKEKELERRLKDAQQ